jgi:NCAIR mutase (PurE)-related protein
LGFDIVKTKKLDLNVEDVLRKLKAGSLTIEEAKRKLSALNIKQVSDLARLDARRAHRIGVPEAVLADGKSPEAVTRSAATMAEESGYALVTRITKEHLKNLRALSSRNFKLDYNKRARTVVITRGGHVFPKMGKVGLLAAGTADIPVAEEAAVAAEVMGCEVIKAFDVGIAGLHRLFEPLGKMMNEGVSVVVAVAGMEGALPSVVASLVDVPVIGVPTSVGYGVGIEGLGALMTMLQSCTPKLAVVNIDNGFGAGVLAALIARQSKPGKVG